MRLHLCFGGIWAWVGWLLVGLGLGIELFLLLIMGFDTQFYKFWGELEQAPATVIRCQQSLLGPSASRSAAC